METNAAPTRVWRPRGWAKGCVIAPAEQAGCETEREAAEPSLSEENYLGPGRARESKRGFASSRGTPSQQ